LLLGFYINPGIDVYESLWAGILSNIAFSVLIVLLINKYKPEEKQTLFSPKLLSNMTNSNGKATTTKRTFSRETSVSVNIQADAKTIWGLLTTSENYPTWNSTVLSIEGKIAPGEKIQLKSYLDPKRVFKLKVKAVEPDRLLVWGDSMGNREFKLTPYSNGQTNFAMTEKIGGPLFPLFAKMIPPFDESFEKFAYDLKKEAEKN